MPPTTVYTCGEVCLLLTEGQLFPLGTPVSSASKLTARIIPQMLKVALNPNQSNPILHLQLASKQTATM